MVFYIISLAQYFVEVIIQIEISFVTVYSLFKSGIYFPCKEKQPCAGKPFYCVLYYRINKQFQIPFLQFRKVSHYTVAIFCHDLITFHGENFFDQEILPKSNLLYVSSCLLLYPRILICSASAHIRRFSRTKVRCN